MELSVFIEQLNQSPATVQFEQSMAVIDANYEFTPTAFINGETKNEANQNNGSCKIFAFAQLNQLTEQDTLACFGRFYREDVLQNPDGDDHANIRNFIKFGWQGIQFESDALVIK
ncbi:HopJ type III effector protein [Vibrio coralliilyticus]|uniref:HopJ type III effector protein n=1 Tax=Vibrio coralliilyticus TaxID=190893 RepID=UPI000810790F|nr:HopJ type III effector protein [Vibrio coralliilyticus]ANW25961.1 type III effector [Vibrio coralliilyticus]NRF23414.1 HopJ type III effector protein [Vibrio coralliilyticus]NRF77876.1 HopJ type III effector protein [Vibrio coralliilyticus]NUW69937.1 HopJ type III effector protein [Vibrio coralliilyticus]PAU36783.1 type III effector [Vibrio coralliilyticus]